MEEFDVQQSQIAAEPERQTISIAEIEQENKTKNENNPKIINFELSDGKKVEMDLTKANGKLLMKARLQQDKTQGVSLSVFILSLLCTFNGSRLSPDEILDLDLDDVLLLETVYTTKKKPLAALEY
ncbi:MAG: hypothetical protein K6C94_02280 [Candidatus Gastranaerophilales bacterium]|nr:hypothetical protein [Candidatus Gastranaerophilales bacterium]